MELFDNSEDKTSDDPQKISANELKKMVQLMDRLVTAVERIKDDVDKIQKTVTK